MAGTRGKRIGPLKKRSSRRTGTPELFSGTDHFDTVGDWLRFAVTVFSQSSLTFAQGLPGPADEAMLLVSRTLGLEPDDLSRLLACKLTRRESTEIKRMIIRRAIDHVPVPYLVNEMVQCGLRFFVDERVLIPRSYIAGLLPDAVAKFAGRGWRARRILDVGTGSGCLAILAARAFPGAVVDAVDLSLDALDVAAANVAAHGLEGAVQLLQSDVFSGVAENAYDLIIANPPYEPSGLLRALPPELRHEPAFALDGGPDGMACVRRILRESRAHLHARGILLLEYGGLQEAVRREFPRLRFSVLSLADGSDAVIGICARDLPGALASRRRRAPRRPGHSSSGRRSA